MDHKIQLDTAIYSPTGLTGTTFASPARRGEYMTPADYKTHYMGRKSSNGMASERYTGARRYRRRPVRR